MKSVTDKLNVSTNILDVPIDLVRTKGGGRLPLAPLGYTNALYCATDFVTSLFHVMSNS